MATEKCTKICYPTVAAARKSMWRESKKRTTPKFLTGVYWCGKCKAYHTTSTPRVVKPRRRRR